MLRYAIFRLIWLIPTLIGMTLVVFVLMHNIPGSPLDPVGANNPLSEQEQKTIAAKYGLDKPLWQQYLIYVKNLARLDLGDSFARRGQSVNTILGRGWRVSLYLGMIAMGIAVVGGVSLGVLAASRQNSPLDYACSVLATMGVAFPNYVVGVFLIYFFVLRLGWIPRTGGLDEPIDWILPSIALALGPLGIIARYVRSSMVEVIRSDYVRTARAKGAAESRVMIRHVLKNALIPPLTIIGPLIAAICTGSPAIELIFRVPGIGRYFADSIVARDYTMIMAVILIFGVFLALMNLIVDLLYGVVDPRIRYS
jgi:ABC-type dipeptide/oligopeptide/nickel transport system permease component